MIALAQPQMARPRKQHPPRTPFQEWFQPAMARCGMDVSDVAREVESDYPHIWKLAYGDPVKYRTSRRPGYALTKAIGIVLGDEAGALIAAGHEEAATPFSVAKTNDQNTRRDATAIPVPVGYQDTDVAIRAAATAAAQDTYKAVVDALRNRQATQTAELPEIEYVSEGVPPEVATVGKIVSRKGSIGYNEERYPVDQRKDDRNSAREMTDEDINEYKD